MAWALRVKLAQNQDAFGDLLRSTGDRPIIESSARGDFWGAIPTDDGRLRGENVLGRLLSELRRKWIEAPEAMQVVDPPELPDWRLLDKPVGKIG